MPNQGCTLSNDGDVCGGKELLTLIVAIWKQILILLILECDFRRKRKIKATLKDLEQKCLKSMTS